jgi:hypothetical protein
MTPEEVQAIVETEIAGDWNRSNPHGVDLNRCLIMPVLGQFVGPPGLSQLWVVLEEYPDFDSGYKVVFDETSQMFGLACCGVSGENVLIGLYGSFLNTLDAM